MVRRAVIAVSLIGCSCNGGEPDDTGEKCTTSILDAYPLEGDADVYSRTRIDATLAREEPDATITVVDDAGAEVPGSLVYDGRRITFVPDVPLTAGVTYTRTLDWSCEPDEATFTVATDVGEPVDGATLIDRTYVMDFRNGRYVTPVGIGAVFDEFLEATILLAIEGSTPAGLQFTAGSAGFDGVQDLCSPTSAYDEVADYSENPYFTSFQSSIRLEVLGDILDIVDLTVDGAFVPGSEYIAGVSLDGILDTRDLKSVAPNSTEEDVVCNLFASISPVECEPCPDGSGSFCMRLIVDGLTMTRAPADLVPRSDAEIAADPTCAEDEGA